MASLKNKLYIAKHFQGKCFEVVLPFLTGKVFDVGCGKQVYKKHFTDYVGMDAIKYKPTLVGGIQDIPLKDKSVNSIICTEVLEHVPNPPRAISEMYRVLKIGGVAYVTVPMYWYTHYAPFDFWRFTQFSLLNMFNRFKILSLDRYGGLNYFIACRIAESIKVPKHLMPVINLILRNYVKLDKFNKRDVAGWTLLVRRAE